MEIITSAPLMQEWARNQRRDGATIACVPTMGYLHEGHLSLVRLAHKKADLVVVTLFVNPTQFGPNEDYNSYPRDPQRDSELCRNEGVAVLFMPQAGEFYADDASVVVSEASLSRGLCGASRPGHFQGVCTVVTKLFNTVLPDVAVFGRKDAQQAAIIRRMVRDLNFPIEIALAPIVREADGLAISSRNVRLSPAERQAALGLSRALRLAERAWQQGESSSRAIRQLIEQELLRSRLRIDYIAIVDGDTLQSVDTLADGVLLALAAFAGAVRLIDNVTL